MVGPIHNLLMTCAAALKRAWRRILMALGAGKKATFDEVLAEGIAKLEQLQVRQKRTMALLRAAAARKKGIDEIRKKISEL